MRSLWKGPLGMDVTAVLSPKASWLHIASEGVADAEPDPRLHPEDDRLLLRFLHPSQVDEAGSITEGGKDVPLGDSLQIQFWVDEGVKPAVNL